MFMLPLPDPLGPGEAGFLLGGPLPPDPVDAWEVWEPFFSLKPLPLLLLPLPFVSPMAAEG